jgi:hypothetical protein
MPSAFFRTFKTAKFAKAAKKAKINDELRAFRLLARAYEGITDKQLKQLLVNEHFVEICHDEKTEIQK